MYKSKLQELCQQKQWALPRYNSMKDGPDHSPRFKSSVFLNATSFHSSPSCKSFKEAQNDAAKAAFLHFTSSSPAAANQAVGGVGLFYKNLLQELTQREGLTAPEYETVQCGLAHKPTFFSSVEVEGQVFQGKEGKSKKEAELLAAQVAYTTLTERLKEPGSGSSNLDLVNDEEDNVQQVKIEEKELVNLSPKQVGSNLATAVEYEQHAEEVKVGEDVLSSCSKSASSVSPTEGGSLSSTSTHVDISALSISDSNVSKDPGVRSYLLHNKVRVYSSFPDIAFPKGITVLPISEDKWIAVSLEFPNEKDD